MTTATHLSSARLLDYYLGDGSLGEASEAAVEVEEHLFDCAECAATLDAIERTAALIVDLVRSGELSSGATTALLNRMSRDRLNVRHYTILPGEIVACTVALDDHFMAGRFVLPEGDFERIDMRVLDGTYNELMRVEDIVIDARYRHALLFIPARPVQSEASGVTHYVLVAPAEHGEREIARYSMDHAALQPDG